MENRKAIIIFLKYPEKGKVKTRLAKTVGTKEALKIYRQFIKITLDKLRKFKEINQFIFYIPKGKKKLLEKSYSSNFTYCLQRGKDLGERMYNALSFINRLGYKQVIIIGTDSPTLPSRFIYQAFSKLNNVDLVLGPCNDGGYYLISIKKPIKELFEDIDWSTNRVFNQTLQKAKHLNLKVKILPCWYDIDTIEDLKNLSSSKSEN